jgi:carboxymethylenebutenolidase
MDVQAAFDNVKVAGKTGIVGYCWGGTAAWLAAARIAGIACSVCYYGGGIANNSGEQPKCPVMFHWGETDHAISVADAAKVAAAHPSAISHMYKGAGHGFNCEQRGSYNAESAKIARGRTLEFLRKHIG